MSLGVEVRTRTAPAGQGVFSQTDTLFMPAPWSAGDDGVAVLCRSLADVEAAFAARTGASIPFWDYMDTYFREGGRRAYVARYTAGDLDLDALFPEDLGPGQVVIPAETPGAAAYEAALAHCQGMGSRVAVFDVGNGDDLTEMEALGDALSAVTQAEGIEYGAAFGPWVEIPPPQGVSGGSARQVPASAVVTALIARADALGNPNRPGAGRDFPLQFGTGFVVDVGMADRITLLNAGVNTFAERYGILQMYGFQTAVPQDETTPFWQFNCSRTRMWLAARAKVAGENYMFKPIDGRGLLARALQSELDEICLELYQADGLYGETPADAFVTEVGVTVNSEEQIANGELHAVVEARLSLHAKRILIDLVSVPVTGSVSQPV